MNTFKDIRYHYNFIKRKTLFEKTNLPQESILKTTTFALPDDGEDLV